MAVSPEFDARYLKMLTVGRHLAGVDEAGRGPLAGPVVAAAVVLGSELRFIEGLDDSKKVPELVRERVAIEIRARAVDWAIAEATTEEIDRFNILRASLIAMRRAVEQLHESPGLALVDGRHTCDALVPQVAVVRGDGKSPSIAAASILAKVHRDGLMRKLAELYPAYGFGKHKGYPTALHRAAIRRHGPCPVHRRTFRGVKEYLP